jgi:uncharacterized protein
MKIIFDPQKDVLNLVKHGISLSAAGDIDWNTLWATPDTRQDYGEVRMIGYALIKTRLHNIVFTDRENERRVISLRKANKREVQHYVNHY